MPLSELQNRVEDTAPHRWRLRLRGDRGSTLVEAAFAITILMTMVIGIMEASLAVYTYHFISNAARDGVRYAIVRGDTWKQSPWNGTTCAAYTNAGCEASEDNISDYVKSLAFPGIDTSNITVSTTSYTISNADGTTSSCANATTSQGGPTRTDTTQPPTCNAVGNLIEVKVVYNFPFSVPFIPRRTLSMSSTARMVVAQ